MMWFLSAVICALTVSARSAVVKEIHCRMACLDFSKVETNQITICGEDDLTEKVCGTEIQCTVHENQTYEMNDNKRRRISDEFPCCYAVSFSEDKNCINTDGFGDDQEFSDQQADAMAIEESAGETLSRIIRSHWILTILVMIALLIEICFVIWQAVRCCKKHKKAFHITRPSRKNYIVSVAKANDGKDEPLTGVTCETPESHDLDP